MIIMKKSILILTFILFSFGIYAQNNVHWSQWSDENTFQASAMPSIKGYGPLSDSLKAIFKVDFFRIGDDYYPIASWADYYYWFINKYWYLFNKNRELYEFYYITGDNLGMAAYIAGNGYLLDSYPSSFVLTHDGQIQVNRLAVYTTACEATTFETEQTMLYKLAQKREEPEPVRKKQDLSSYANTGFLHNSNGSKSSASPGGVSSRNGSSNSSSFTSQNTKGTNN